MTATTIFDELRMATPDVAARRAMLLDAAEHGDNLDPLHRDHLVERYADQDMNPVDRSRLFTGLITEVQKWDDVKKWRGDSYVTDDGFDRTEELDRLAGEVWSLLELLVPSPVFAVADEAPSSFDEPLADEAGVA